MCKFTMKLLTIGGGGGGGGRPRALGFPQKY
jgi:hypothetical protein